MNYVYKIVNKQNYMYRMQDLEVRTVLFLIQYCVFLEMATANNHYFNK